MRKILLILVLVITQILGDIWLSRGMKAFGEVAIFSPADLTELFIYLLTSPWILLGVGTLMFSLLLYWMAISHLDVSYVLPMHASSYVFNALLAGIMLQETVSWIRWIATIIIAFGVFIVGWSESKQDSLKSSSPVPKSKQTSQKMGNVALFLFTFGSVVSKVWLGVFGVAFADATGDILTAIGIRRIGKVPLSFSKIWTWIGNILRQPLIFIGVGGYAIAFVLFIALLSWADISFIRPATAIGYAFSLLGARFILHEQIASGRLLGILVVGFGVGVLSLG